MVTIAIASGEGNLSDSNATDDEFDTDNENFEDDDNSSLIMHAI